MTVLKQRSQELQTVAWRSGKVRLIDQTALPDELRYVNLADWREVAEAIRTMVVRGAPAIGCTAALGLAQSARGIIAESREALIARMEDIAGSLEQARPTAVNLGWAVRRVMRVAENTPGSADDVRDAVLEEALDMLAEDVEVNRRLGSYGAERLPAGGSVLTHCNAGALATVAFGTALGVIRAAVEAGKRIHVYADETRPR
ncbi:MAG TPA: S-methyl-5-thioribose-1-phosphate isomerase, partial [Chthonomonadales bacterium]|nr:S-methyl-5-thioribose-1-phosphate isomerase [Chthonomonadales bacterium]